MGQDQLDANTSKEIEKVTWGLLREAGITSPPVKVPAIIEQLDLYREFYDLQNPTFLERTKHKIIVDGRKLIDIVSRIKLVAVLFFDEDRIVLDTGLPTIKHDWATCHEVGHSVLPWHKAYFRGDTAQTLDPAWQEQLEAEANYAASELMFCGPVFDQEARDVTPNWEGFAKLAQRYGKSMTATLRRLVTHSPDQVMAMTVSTPFWKEKPADQPKRWRHFAMSPRFRADFANVTPEALLAHVDAHSEQRSGGPVAEFAFSLDDDDGESHEFYAKSFYNRYYILTLFVEMRKRSARKIIVPGYAAL